MDTESSTAPTPAFSRRVSDAEASVCPVRLPQSAGGHGTSTMGSGDRLAARAAELFAGFPSHPPAPEDQTSHCERAERAHPGSSADRSHHAVSRGGAA
jgi:hypothetical protein